MKKRVEPDQPLEYYIKLAGGKKKILPLPAPEPGYDPILDEPAPPPPLDPDLVVAVEAPHPKPKPKRKKPSEIPLPMAKAAPAPAEPAPPPLPPPAPEPPLGGGGPGGPSEGGPVCLGDPPDPLPDPEHHGPGAARDPDLVVAPAPERVEANPRRMMDWKDALGGGKIRFDPYGKRGGGIYRNFRITCIVCPRYKACAKVKGPPEGNEGPEADIQTLAFLHAWRLMHIPGDALSHRRLNPKDEEVQSYLDYHREELVELAGRCCRNV